MNSKPLIITGCPRSGTSRINLCLNAHPKIFTTHESTCFNNWNNKKFGKWLGKKLIIDKNRQRYFNMKGLSAKRIGHLLINSSSSFTGRDYFKLIKRQVSSQYYLGDKNPYRYLIRLEELLRFHQGRGVIIIRDARGVITSSLTNFQQGKRAWWMKNNLQEIENIWLECMELTKELKKRTDTYVLKFEDLLTQGEKELRALSNFLDLTYNKKMLDTLNPRLDKLNTWSTTLPNITKQLTNKTLDFLNAWGYLDEN